MEKNKERKYGISGYALKWIAIVTMFIDHFACVFFEGNYTSGNHQFLNSCFQGNEILFFKVYEWMRSIGRLAFPIFVFLLVQGFMYTGDRKKYWARMFLFCLLSEIPFDLAFHGSWFNLEYQNVFFTLWIGLTLLIAMEWLQTNGKQKLQWLVIFGAILLAEGLQTDYGGHGIVLIVVFYLLRWDEKWRIVLGSFYEIFIIGWLEAPAVIAFLPMHFYNGTKGKGMKYFFYLFYPLHLLFLYMANRLLFY